MNRELGDARATRSEAEFEVPGPSGSCLSVDIRDKRFSAERPVLGPLRFVVNSGEFVSVLAPSGAGKTTLLRLVAGLDVDYAGEIMVSGKRVVGPGVDRGIVFQDSRLLPWLTVEGNVAFGLPDQLDHAEKAVRTDQILGSVNLSDVKHLLPHQLSGGMERRVALARALVNLPKVLLLDEPLSALDLSMRHSLQDQIAAIHDRETLTTILVTHDIEEAMFFSDRIIVLSGSPARIADDMPIEFPRKRGRPETGVRSELNRLMDSIWLRRP